MSERNDRRARSGGLGHHPRVAVLLLALLLTPLALRALLPVAAEWALENGVSGAIVGRLTVGDLGLSLLEGAVTIADARLEDEAAPGDAEPAARLERLHARIAWRDLLERRVRLRALDVDGLALSVRRDAAGELDLVSLLQPSRRAAEASPDAAPKAPDSGPDDGGAGWSFALDRAALADGSIRFREVGVGSPGEWQLTLDELTARRIGFEPGVFASPARLSLSGNVQEGAVAFEASFDRGADPSSLRLDLDVRALPIDASSAYLHAVAWSELSGRLDAALHYEGDARGDGAVRADVSLHDFSARTPGRDEPELRWGELAIRLEGSQGGFFRPLELSGEVELADLSTDSGRDVEHCLGSLEELGATVDRVAVAAPGDGEAPLLSVAVDEVSLRGPALRLSRGEHGFSCRPALAEAVDEGEAADAGLDLRFEVGALELADGRLALHDRTVEPWVETTLEPFEGRIESLSGPPFAARHLELAAGGLGVEPLAVEGSLEEGALRLEARAERVELARLNPYLGRHAGLAAEGGDVSSRLELRAAPAEGVGGQLRIVLHDVAFTAIDEEGARRSLGTSLPLAMALLRNPAGDIVLDVPFSRSGDLTELDLVDVAARSIGRAFANALLSPIKLLGAALPSGRDGEPLEPAPLRFEPGRSELDETAAQGLASVAELLARRPWLGVQVTPRVVDADADRIGDRPGVRADTDRLAELGEARGQRVADAFAEKHGVSRRRIAIRSPTGARDGARGADAPRVELGLAPLEQLASPEDTAPAAEG